MSSAFEEQVFETIRRHHMISAGERVMIAVSGGPDSMALLDFLNRNQRRLGAHLAVFHFDHQLRGEESLREQEFVLSAAKHLGLEIVLRKARVSEYCDSNKLSIEEGARQLRHQAMQEAATELGAVKIALAHHLDDHLETFFWRSLTGTSLDGLCGISPVRGNLIRPFIEALKQDILEYCAERQVDYATDSSNLTLGPLRNRIRLELAPLLDSVRPGWKRALAKTIGLLSQDRDYFQEMVAPLAAMIKKSESGAEVPLESIRNAPMAIRTRGLKRLSEVAGLELESRHILLMLALLEEGPGECLHLPGKKEAVAVDGKLLIRDIQEPASSPEFSITIDGTGTYPLPDGRSLMVAFVETGETRSPSAEEPVFDFDKLGFPLTLRNTLPGDRLKPLGMSGKSKKISDMLIDRKISREARTNSYVLQRGDEIVWLTGVEISESFKTLPTTLRRLNLRLSGG